MAIELWLTFVATSAVLLVIPGPTILTVISYSLSHGAKVKIPLILAVALGDSTALALSLLGLGVLLAESAFWFQAVKWMGGLYLIFLGIQLLLAGIKKPELSITDHRQKQSSWKLFTNTYLVTALNPKGILFFVAFLPQFINAEAHIGSQLWILSLTFVALAAFNASMYALFAGKAQKALSSPNTHRRFNLCGGTLLTIAGLWALTTKRI